MSPAAAVAVRPPAVAERSAPAARCVDWTGCWAAQLALPMLRAGVGVGLAAPRAPAPASAVARLRSCCEKRARPAGVAFAAMLRAPGPEAARPVLGLAVLVRPVMAPV